MKAHLGLCVCRSSLGCGDDHVGDSVSQLGRASGVSFPHLVGELDVGLLRRVVLVGLGQLFGDDLIKQKNALHGKKVSVVVPQ